MFAACVFNRKGYSAETEMKPKYRIVTRGGNAAMDRMASLIAREGMPPGARIIYDERNRLFRVYVDSVPYIVKAFRCPNAVNSVAYVTVRSSKAARSYRNALRLEGMGIATPRPEAYMEVRRGGRLRESYYICRDVECPQIRHWERRPDSEPMLAAFADDMLGLHIKGVWHKDFSPGNILVKNKKGGGYRFYYIDLNRMRFGVHDPKRLLSMFGRMHEEEEELRDLARHYAEALRRAEAEGRPIPAGMDPATVEDRAVEAFHSFWDRHARKQRLKKHLAHKHKVSK